MAPYGRMEKVLELINSRCISLETEEIKHNNELLKSKINELLIPEMKKDPLFFEIFTTIAYGGSYYDGLKVGKPDEFDLDFKLFLPKCEDHNKWRCKECVQITSFVDKPGYVGFKVTSTKSEKFNSFIENGYVRNDRVIKQWFKGIISKALKKIEVELKKQAKLDDIKLKEKEDEVPPKYKSESGPAITLEVKGKFGSINIDLVPAFEFDSDYWPVDFRPQSPENDDGFLIVPKDIEGDNCGKYWRASFQVQEKQIIYNKQRLKPALRLLKKTRTSHHELISSYALKTIVLWDLEDLENSFNYIHGNLSECFLYLLKCYKDKLYEKEISYYWKPESNLLNGKRDCFPQTLNNYYNHLNKMLKNLERDPSNPYEIAKLILKAGTEEYKKIISEMQENDDLYHISDYNSYENIEPTLHIINSAFLEPKYIEYKRIKTIIEKDLLPTMINKNTLFKKMCEETLFFHDNYFNNFGQMAYVVLLLPKCELCKIRNCKCVSVCISDKKKFLFFRMEKHFNEELNMFVIKGFLQGYKILLWLYDLIDETLNDPELKHTMKENKWNCFIEYSMERSLVLRFTTKFGNLDIDIAPAFKFTFDALPKLFRLNPTEQENVFIVPVQDCYNYEQYWWPCFHYQEKMLLKNKQWLNLAFKLLKKTRDSRHHFQILDYELKTILLQDPQLNKPDFHKSLGDTFIYFLEKYSKQLGKNEIRYYWKEKRSFNLWDQIESTKLDEYYQEIKEKISEFKDDYLLHPEFIAKIILGEETQEYEKFIEKKNEKSIPSSDETTSSEDEDGAMFPDLGGRYHDLLERRQPRNVVIEPNEWAIAAGVVGAVALVGFGIWGAVSYANRNNNRRQ